MNKLLNSIFLFIFIFQLSAQSDYPISNFTAKIAYNFILNDIIYSDKIYDFYPIITDDIDPQNGYFSVSTTMYNQADFDYLIPETEQEKIKYGEIHFKFQNLNHSNLITILPIRFTEKTLDYSPVILKNPYCIAHLQFTDIIKQDDLYTIGIAYIRRVPGKNDYYGTYLKYDFVICNNEIPRFKKVHSNHYSRIITNWDCE